MVYTQAIQVQATKVVAEVVASRQEENPLNLAQVVELEQQVYNLL